MTGKPTDEFDVVIVGGGPAGASVALHLCKLDPTLAERILILEKAVFPRKKLCGGGVTSIGEQVLDYLGLDAAELDSFDVKRAKVCWEGKKNLVFEGNPVFKIFCRQEFDHWMIREARKLGVTVSEGESITDLTRTEDGNPIVSTKLRDITAKVVVGADGVGSKVRKLAGLADESGGEKFPAPPLCALIETLTPEDRQKCREFAEAEAVFDFTILEKGISGYVWDFPSFVEGEAMMNRGIFDSRLPGRDPGTEKPRMKDELSKRLNGSVTQAQIKGWSLRSYDPERKISAPGVLLTGDANGADPLVGEGISFALANGRPAAQSIHEAFESGNFSFTDYHRRVASQPEFTHLAKRCQVAKFFYKTGPALLFRQQLVWTLGAQIMKLANLTYRGFDPFR